MKIAFSNLYSFSREKKSKLELCRENNCRFLVEDNPKHIIEVVEEIPVIALRKPWNKELKETSMIRIAKNLEEAVAIAIKIYQKDNLIFNHASQFLY